MKRNDEMVIARVAGLTWIRNKEGIVFEKGFALNDAAAVFFMAIDGKRSFRALCEKVQNDYDVEYDELSADMFELVEEMVEAKLLQVVS